MKENDWELYQTKVLDKRWLSERILEVVLQRPEGFAFIPGQKVRISNGEFGREYTLINSPDASGLIICVHYIIGGRFSSVLEDAKIGSTFFLSAATGYFIYQTEEKQAVFVATGTGIAPFLAFIRAGITDFILLHGVREQRDILYRDEITAASGKYLPCITGSKCNGLFWNGRVTVYLRECLAEGEYDFYLCGNGDMIHDAFQIIDRKFSGSRIFSETFF